MQSMIINIFKHNAFK